MEYMPWLFWFEDAAGAVEVARELYELGAVVIADPEHLPERLLDQLVSVSAVEGEVVWARVHEVDWAVALDWSAGEPEHTASNLFCLLNSPGEMFDSVESLPEGTPERVVAWLGLDDDEEEG